MKKKEEMEECTDRKLRLLVQTSLSKQSRPAHAPSMDVPVRYFSIFNIINVDFGLLTDLSLTQKHLSPVLSPEPGAAGLLSGLFPVLLSRINSQQV